MNPRELLRRVLIAWLFAAVLEFLLVSERILSDTAILSQMSVLRVALVTIAVAAALQYAALQEKIERWILVGAFAAYAGVCLSADFSEGFLGICVVIFAILIVYAVFGRQEERPLARAKKGNPLWYIPLAVIAVAFFAAVSAWTVCRFLSFFNATYDFGIFTQMFYNMKQSGVPMTTLERGRELSHFAVHMSPIYYLMLPFYCLAPSPVTLQVLQAAILASAVIPLYKLARLHGLSGLQGLLLCAVLLVFPAFSGGTSYDLHENCFLTPLILWLFYAADTKNRALATVFAVLTLMVKEDAAVYVAVIALWLLLRSKDDRVFALCLLAGALAWFLAVTAYLRSFGDGVMSNRYENFMPETGSLFEVVKAAFLCPMKVLYESFEAEKLEFVFQTMLPLAFLPLVTRKYERFLLLIPYVLVNLMSDYPYQHDIMFQYTYGPTAFLFYLTAVNLADFPKIRIAPLCLALACGVNIFSQTVKPTAQRVCEQYVEYREYYEDVRYTLALIPDGASVTATAFYTPHLSEREVLYDVLQCTKAQLLSTEYVVLQKNADGEYVNFGGFEGLVALLEQNGYALRYELPDVLTIYQKS